MQQFGASMFHMVMHWHKLWWGEKWVHFTYFRRLSQRAKNY